MSKRPILFLLFCFFTITVFSQYTFKRELPREANGDSSYWMTWADNTSKHLGIERLFLTDDSLHYRYWTNEQIVDVWMKEDGTFRGKVVNFAKTYEPYDFANNAQKPSLYYSDFDLLNDSTTMAIFRLFQSVKTLPTEDSIAGWFQGLVGVSYELECVNGNDYSIRHYWSPQSQDTTDVQVREMMDFMQAMQSTLSLNKRYVAFQNTLAPGAYSTDGYMIMRVLTKKQKKKAAKYARKHPATS